MLLVPGGIASLIKQFTNSEQESYVICDSSGFEIADHDGTQGILYCSNYNYRNYFKYILWFMRLLEIHFMIYEIIWNTFYDLWEIYCHLYWISLKIDVTLKVIVIKLSMATQLEDWTLAYCRINLDETQTNFGEECSLCEIPFVHLSKTLLH